jgi:hypothetical protein
LAGLVALIPSIHLVLGVLMVTGALDVEDDARFVGCFLIAIASVFMAAGFTFAILLVRAGRCLRGHRSYTFCLVMAAISCAFTPFGTVLGVLTLVVLMRPSVKELFGVSGPDAAGAAAP